LSFIIITVYVDDLNIIGSPEEIKKNEFKMKDLGVIKLCLGLQIEHFHNDIFVHQSNYIQNMLKRFNMDKAHPLSTPMIVRSLDMKKDPYRPRENNEKALDPEVPYLSAIGCLHMTTL
jgi:Reverse transcriptase (RNA-dependent DNA polymerase)